MDNNFFISGKSLVNFCENDTYLMGIAEPWNVVSSLIIVFLGLYGYYINKFNNLKNKIQLNILYILLTFVGLSSMFFHSYLSPYSHWVDIILISIILIYSQFVLSNKNKLITKIKYLIMFMLHLYTSIILPQAHLFLLFSTGFLIKNTIENKINLNYQNELRLNKKIILEYLLIKKYFFIGLFFWIIDFFLCKFIKPYHVHWIFHIFIGLVSYKIISLLKYF